MWCAGVYLLAKETKNFIQFQLSQIHTIIPMLPRNIKLIGMKSFAVVLYGESFPSIPSWQGIP